MDAIPYATAEQKLGETLDAVCENHTPVIVTRPTGEAVVILSLSDFNSIQETMYLLENPANAEHLRQSIAAAEAGKVTAVSVDEL